MGVYIPNMEMPTSCRACPLATRFFDGEDVCAMLGTYVHDRDREDDCPLVSVPPHGDLIDRRELVKHDHQHYEYLSDEFYVTVRDIEEAPTIIEAEEGET